jgi:hypothetical protein
MQSTEQGALVDIRRIVVVLEEAESGVQIVVVVVGKLTSMGPSTMEKRSSSSG